MPGAAAIWQPRLNDKGPAAWRCGAFVAYAGAHNRGSRLSPKSLISGLSRWRAQRS